MPKTLDVKCSDGHIRRNKFYRHMEDELGTCDFIVDNGERADVRCGLPLVSVWDKVGHIEIAGLFTEVTYNGVADDVQFTSTKEMDAHLNKLREEHHDPTLTYHFPSRQEVKRKQADAKERYMERRRAEGVTESELKRAREARLNGEKF